MSDTNQFSNRGVSAHDRLWVTILSSIWISLQHTTWKNRKWVNCTQVVQSCLSHMWSNREWVLGFPSSKAQIIWPLPVQIVSNTFNCQVFLLYLIQACPTVGGWQHWNVIWDRKSHHVSSHMTNRQWVTLTYFFAKQPFHDQQQVRDTAFFVCHWAVSSIMSHPMTIGCECHSLILFARWSH